MALYCTHICHSGLLSVTQRHQALASRGLSADSALASTMLLAALSPLALSEMRLLILYSLAPISSSKKLSFTPQTRQGLKVP